MSRIIVLDTEALGLDDPQVYEIGYVVATADGKVLKERDYIIKQIYDNEELFQSAYYANKRPLYEQKLADGQAKKVWWGYALRVLANDIEKYGVDNLYAYNSKFDMGAINHTSKLLGAKAKPTADGIYDIMWFISKIIKSKAYKEFCRVNGYMTKHATPQCQKKAETLYRFLTNNTEFIEDHMALEDSRIELEILMKALGR